MSEEINPPPDPKGLKTPGQGVVWLLLAFVPSVVSIPVVGKNSSDFPLKSLLALTIVCCVCAGFGILRDTKNLAARIFFSVLLAGVFFVLNVFIVILIGCSGMGRIAP
jgi:hypothetical protein